MKITNYMAEQPQAIVESFAEARRCFRELAIDSDATLTLIGSGSSLNACLVAGSAFSGVEIIAPADYLQRQSRPAADRQLVVVLTQSGASTTSIAAASTAHEAGAQVLIVTANPRSPASGLGLPLVVMPIGDEPIGPKTKGYSASCATLLALAAHRGAAVSAPDGEALENALAQSQSRVAELAPEFDQLDYVLVSGAGMHFGTALEGSLKIAEIAGVPTAAFSLEETLHGRLHGTTSASLCLPIVSDDATRGQAARIAGAMKDHGVRVEAVQAIASGGLFGPWAAIASTFFFQALAVELCLRRGREPDLMHYPGLTRSLDIKTDAIP